MIDNTETQAPLLLDADQTARLLNVKRSTILNQHRVGRLRGVRCGRHLRWTKEAVERFVEQLEQEAAE